MGTISEEPITFAYPDDEAGWAEYRTGYVSVAVCTVQLQLNLQLPKHSFKNHAKTLLLFEGGKGGGH